jgi:rhodanese-related sulfurtransferase
MDVQAITREALKQKIDRRERFVLVDVLSPAAYAKGHLPGAINVPSERLAELAPSLLPDKHAAIIVYCSSPT